MYVVKIPMGIVGPFKTMRQLEKWLNGTPYATSTNVEKRVLFEPLPWDIFTEVSPGLEKLDDPTITIGSTNQSQTRDSRRSSQNSTSS